MIIKAPPSVHVDKRQFWCNWIIPDDRSGRLKSVKTKSSHFLSNFFIIFNLVNYCSHSLPNHHHHHSNDISTDTLQVINSATSPKFYCKLANKAEREERNKSHHPLTTMFANQLILFELKEKSLSSGMSSNQDNRPTDRPTNNNYVCTCVSVFY